MKRMLAALAALALNTSGGASLAGGYAVSEQTAVAAGTGGASTARTDDAGAAWYNPAALADGGGVRAGLNLIAAYASLTAEGSTSDGIDSQPFQTDSDNGLKTPASLQLSIADGRWAAGLSIGVPFGSGVTWPTDWPGRHEIVRSQVTIVRAAPFFAWSFGRVSVSGGVHLDAARMQLGRSLDFVAEEGDVAIDMDGWGIGAHASVLAHATPTLTVGASYKSRTHLDLEGGADFEAPLAFSRKTMDQVATTRLTVPDRLAIGAHWRRGTLSVYSDLEVLMWGVHDRLTIDFANDETPDVVQTNNWKAAAAIRAGAELAVGPKTQVRAGVFYDGSPVPSETLTPSSPDADRIGLSAGVSHTLPQSLSIDAFYELMMLRGRESQSPEALQARYGGHAHFVGLGLRWQP